MRRSAAISLPITAFGGGAVVQRSSSRPFSCTQTRVLLSQQQEWDPFMGFGSRTATTPTSSGAAGEEGGGTRKTSGSSPTWADSKRAFQGRSQAGLPPELQRGGAGFMRNARAGAGHQPLMKDAVGNSIDPATGKPLELAELRRRELRRQREMLQQQQASREAGRSGQGVVNRPNPNTGRVESKSIFDARNAIAQLRKRGGDDVDPVEMYVARLDLLSMLCSTPRLKDTHEAKKLGQDLWKEVESGLIKLPESFQRSKVFLARCNAIAERKLGNEIKATSWESAANTLVDLQGPIGESEKIGYAPPTSVPDTVSGKALVKRRTGAFTYDKNGNEKQLFHMEHPMFEHQKHFNGNLTGTVMGKSGGYYQK